LHRQTHSTIILHPLHDFFTSGRIMLYLVCLVCMSPLSVSDDPRDEKIKQFLKASDREAIELYLWNNPRRTVTLNDIMLIYRLQCLRQQKDRTPSESPTQTH
jgi:hypothetical protein